MTPLPTLRERRRVELRDQLSSAATRLFLERGYDAVRVRDVADACGVTEKTVYNHFPTKESLLADRWDDLTASVCEPLGHRGPNAVEVVVGALHGELAFLTATTHELADVRRFGELLATTPALRSHHQLRLQQLGQQTALALAARTGRGAEDPGVQVAAHALCGLVGVFHASLRRHLAEDDVRALRRGVRRDLAEAADVLRGGLDVHLD